MNYFLKILLALGLSFIILAGGMFVYILMAFDGASELSKGTAVLLTVCTEFLLMFILFDASMRKRLYQALGFIYVIAALIFLGQWIWNYIDSRITMVKDTVQLEQYAPFAASTKAVSLDRKSKTKITGDLPVMDGATALYPLYSAFARAVYPQKDYDVYTSEVMCNNTIDAYQAVVDGKADVIFVARPSQEQLDYAKEKGVELVLTPIGKEAFVFFVNSKNAVSSVTLDQIRKIYSGEITNWKPLGGGSSEIKAFQRPEGSGSQTMLRHMMGDYKLMVPIRERERIQMMGGIIREASSYKNYKTAIGYSFLYFATEMVRNKEIKLLKIDQVAPTRANIENGTYPLSADFFAVTLRSPKPSVKKLISFIQSDEGREIIKKTGYTPLSKSH